MSHAFVLQPDLALLERYSYEYVCPLEIEPVWTEEQRLRLEKSFQQLCYAYNLTDNYNTLFYIVLVEHNLADVKFQTYHLAYNQHKRIKELAQLLLFFKPIQRHQPNAIKIDSIVDTLKITDANLIAWVGQLINKAVSELNFVPGELGEEVLTFVEHELQDQHIEQHLLAYDRIEQYANRKLRKPTVRERNKVLVPFLLQVLHFLNKETSLCAPPTIRFTDQQLNFLYELATILEWIDDKRVGSEGKDYMGTLLLNHLIR